MGKATDRMERVADMMDTAWTGLDDQAKRQSVAALLELMASHPTMGPRALCDFVGQYQCNVVAARVKADASYAGPYVPTDLRTSGQWGHEGVRVKGPGLVTQFENRRGRTITWIVWDRSMTDLAPDAIVAPRPKNALPARISEELAGRVAMAQQLGNATAHGFARVLYRYAAGRTAPADLSGLVRDTLDATLERLDDVSALVRAFKGGNPKSHAWGLLAHGSGAQVAA